MDNYNEIYYYLFNRITDMIEEMKSIQQFAEELFISGSENNAHCYVDTQQSWPTYKNPAINRWVLLFYKSSVYSFFVEVIFCKTVIARLPPVEQSL